MDRELTRRGYSLTSFARSIDFAPERLEAILDGALDIEDAIAQKIENGLELENGILMELQFHYQARQELSRQHQGQYPDLSRIRRILFWDTSIEKIDWVRQKRSVILRVFERGNAREKVVIRQFYGKDVVAAVLAQGRRT